MKKPIKKTQKKVGQLAPPDDSGMTPLPTKSKPAKLPPPPKLVEATGGTPAETTVKKTVIKETTSVVPKKSVPEKTEQPTEKPATPVLQRKQALPATASEELNAAGIAGIKADLGEFKKASQKFADAQDVQKKELAKLREELSKGLPLTAKPKEKRWYDRIRSILPYIAALVALLYAINRYGNWHANTSSAVAPIAIADKAGMPDEATRKAIMVEVDRANSAVARTGETQRQLELARYAQERAESNSTYLATIVLTNLARPTLVINGNGNIVGSTVTVHEIRQPQQVAPPKPRAQYIPTPAPQPQVQVAPAEVPQTVYVQPPVVYGGGYAPRRSCGFSIGISPFLGIRIGNRYGYGRSAPGPCGPPRIWWWLTDMWPVRLQQRAPIDPP